MRRRPGHRATVLAVPQNNAKIRDEFEAERTSLLHHIDELTAGGEIELDFDDDFSDRGQVASEQGENLALADSFRSKLSEVELALARLADGSYGTCEVCGQDISEARLEALPATSRCIEHADGTD